MLLLYWGCINSLLQAECDSYSEKIPAEQQYAESPPGSPLISMAGSTTVAASFPWGEIQAFPRAKSLLGWWSTRKYRHTKHKHAIMIIKIYIYKIWNRVDWRHSEERSWCERHWWWDEGVRKTLTVRWRGAKDSDGKMKGCERPWWWNEGVRKKLTVS